MIEKTAIDMVSMIAVLNKAYLAKMDATDATRYEKWDQAAAYYIGKSDQQSATTYGRADKRGGNYGQLASSGESAVNTAIIAAFNAGKQGTQSVMTTQYDVILKNYKILYTQATLRYANLIDVDLAGNKDSLAENVAEGQAFYRLVYPWVKTADTANVVWDMFDTNKEPNAANHYNYCAAKAILLAALTITDAELGSLDAAQGVTCGASLPTGLPKITSKAGDYTPAGPVGASLAFSDAVNTVVSKISDDANNGDVVNAAYADTGLKGIADKNRAMTGDSNDWDKFVAHFGANNWLSALIAKATAKPVKIKNAGARAEIIEKTIMDSIAMQAILYDLHMATMDTGTVKAGRTLTDATKRAYWDAGAAKFLGSTTGSKKTVYARANKRAANYGTFDTDGETAKANKKIVQALNAGATATTKAAREAQLNIIRDQMKVIYTQASLRYVWLVDRDLAEGRAFEEHQAEGMAFYNNIAPYVKASDPAGHKVLEAIFDVDTHPDSFNYHSFCVAKATLTKFLGNLASTDMGTLEGTSAVTCPSTLLTGLPSMVTKAGTYTPAGDVGASLSFSVAAKAVTDLIGDSTDYAKVKATFKAQGLAGSADRSRTGETVYDLFRAYFGKDNWMTSYFYGASDGTSLTSSAAGRAEILEKTARDAIAVNAILSDLYKGTLGTDTAARRHWDRGAAKFIGANTATVYGRANKRAANYGTLDADGVTAKANKAIIAALNAGAATGSTTTKVAEFHKVIAQMKVIYAQCVLRYAFLIDSDVATSASYDEHQAEGQAFWRVLAPWVNEKDRNGASYLTGIFDLSRAPKHTNHFCHTKEILAKLDINAADFGTLEKTSAINCAGVNAPTDADAYFSKADAAAKTTTVSSGASAGIAPAAFAAIVSVALALFMA